MSGSSSPSPGDGPQLFRPVPRRPFNLNLNNFIPSPPPEDNSSNNDSAPGTPQPTITARDLAFLKQHVTSNPSTDNFSIADAPLSRADSFMNLASSTLYGIYSPALSSPGDRERVTSSGFGVGDRYYDDPPTPWGVGSGTPALAQRDISNDGGAFGGTRSRSGTLLGRTSYFNDLTGLGISGEPLTLEPATTNTSAAAAAAAATTAAAERPPTAAQSQSKVATAFSLFLRASLLFTLGMGYGALVTQLPSRQNLGAFGVVGGEGISKSTLLLLQQAGYDWRYLAFWGSAGVALGGLLPWFDSVWEDTFGRRRRGASGNVAAHASVAKVQGDVSGTTEKVSVEDGAPHEADWALVIRGIGAFVGIVFAIRRLPWTSTMQISLTLALANPFLWYLIDRSKPGFLLSAAVGVVGSITIMGVGMPASAGLMSPLAGGASLVNNRTGAGAIQHPRSASSSSPRGGFTSQENIETGIWMLSVLFCSCVCFGNIGRRLALNRSASARGRWGGLR
ncbi:insulin-induced protein [Cercophora scortea]|uniref:Insulin-induced protein n=1 Tax=Cercophora scortea TaxID=314031 RepID=A0AAE0MIW9_9PEZI|nr:insulin-induced protein [Cercophora scortea]